MGLRGKVAFLEKTGTFWANFLENFESTSKHTIEKIYKKDPNNSNFSEKVIV